MVSHKYALCLPKVQALPFSYKLEDRFLPALGQLSPRLNQSDNQILCSARSAHDPAHCLPVMFQTLKIQYPRLQYLRILLFDIQKQVHFFLQIPESAPNLYRLHASAENEQISHVPSWNQSSQTGPRTGAD